MTLKKIIVPILILLALLVIIDRLAMRDAFWQASSSEMRSDRHADSEARDSGNPSSVTYVCKEGVIEADFGPDSMGLLLVSSAQSFTLPQVRSGSGIRYEKDGLQFAGKGTEAVITQNGTAIFSDCVARTADPAI